MFVPVVFSELLALMGADRQLRLCSRVFCVVRIRLSGSLSYYDCCSSLILLMVSGGIHRRSFDLYDDNL